MDMDIELDRYVSYAIIGAFTTHRQRLIDVWIRLGFIVYIAEDQADFLLTNVGMAIVADTPKAPLAQCWRASQVALGRLKPE